MPSGGKPTAYIGGGMSSAHLLVANQLSGGYPFCVLLSYRFLVYLRFIHSLCSMLIHLLSVPCLFYLLLIRYISVIYLSLATDFYQTMNGYGSLTMNRPITFGYSLM